MTVTVLVVLLLFGVFLGLRVVKQYERGVLFGFGRLVGTRKPGLVSTTPVTAPHGEPRPVPA